MHKITRIACFLFICIYINTFYSAFAESNSAKKIEHDLIKHLNKPWSGDLDEIKERRYIRILVTYSKTNFFLDGAVSKGITAESFKIFEKWLNLRLKTKKYPVHVAFIPVRRDELLTGLVSGKGDIAAAGLSITAGREELIDFAEPWASDVQEIVISGPESPALNTLDDLAGQAVWVRRSSSYHESLVALNKRFASEGKEPVQIMDADENLESEDIMEMVGAGLLPLTVVDKYRADLWAKIIPNIRVRDDLRIAEGQRVAWAVRKENPQLRALINEFAAFFKNSPDYSFLGQKYFTKTGYLRNPTASEDMRRFLNATEFFKKYGKKYDLDFLLIAAQAYQESQLDQNARSPRGAVGVMQLLPSTAAAPPISLSKIENLETNIHAGVKYHRHIIDTYFKDPALSPVNRMLFAFAAYNAGPGNVSKMLRLTKELGLDPTKWFANVEIAAGKITGQETVRYVGNIYKYYIAYLLTMERVQERDATKKSGKAI